MGFLIGSTVDIVGTNIWGFFLTIYILINFHLIQSPPLATGEISARLLNIIKTDPGIIVANMIVGSLFTILGGYIGASIAKHDELLNGALSSIFCLSSDIYGIVIGATNSVPLALVFLSLLLSPFLALLGGFLRLKQRNRKTAKLVISQALSKPEIVDVT